MVIYAPQLSWQSARNTMLNGLKVIYCHRIYLGQSIDRPQQYNTIYTIKCYNIRVYYYPVVFKWHVVIVEPMCTERRFCVIIFLKTLSPRTPLSNKLTLTGRRRCATVGGRVIAGVTWLYAQIVKPASRRPPSADSLIYSLTGTRAHPPPQSAIDHPTTNRPPRTRTPGPNNPLRPRRWETENGCVCVCVVPPHPFVIVKRTRKSIDLDRVQSDHEEIAARRLRSFAIIFVIMILLLLLLLLLWILLLLRRYCVS